MFSDQKTLREAIEEDTLPVVVRTCEKCGSKGDDRGEQMEDGTLISIDRKETLDYMHIKVVGVNDEDESAKRYGSEFVYERAAYVGEEYLIPVRYPRKLSHVHRPGKRNKYTSVAQVRFLYLQYCTLAFCVILTRRNRRVYKSYKRLLFHINASQLGLYESEAVYTRPYNLPKVNVLRKLSKHNWLYMIMT